MFSGGTARILALSLIIAIALVPWFLIESNASENNLRLHPKLQRTLVTLVRSVEAGLSAKVPQIGFSEDAPLDHKAFVTSLADQRVHVVVETGSTENAAVIQRIRQLEGTIETSFEQWVQAWVPVASLLDLADEESVKFIRQPVQRLRTATKTDYKSTYQGTIVGEGVAPIQAPAWQQAGFTGDGVKVAVIDTFAGYERLVGRELPSDEKITTRSFAPHGEVFDPFAPNQHGVGVSEVIYDIAPDAELFLTYFETDVEFRQAVDWLVDQQVDVVNTSLGFPSGCFEEGGGFFEHVFASAKAAGITWATASGNEADVHWADTFNDPDGDGLHNYGNGADEGNTMQIVLSEFVYPGGRRVATSVLAGFFAWEAPCGSANEDYEVVIFRQTDDGQLEPLQPFNGEQGMVSDWMWRPGFPVVQFFASEDFDSSLIGQTVIYHLGIRKLNDNAGGAKLDIQLISCSAFCESVQYIDPEGSVSFTEPAISSNVMTVGASHHSPDGCPDSLCPQSPLLVYSSQGPTPFGTHKPEIVAPSHVSTSAFGSWTGNSAGSRFGFTGTSAASPHVAGAAALVLHAFPEFDQDDVEAFLMARAEDFGAPGPDNVFGAGVLQMGQPPIADRTAPLAPLNLTVAPATWSNSASFELDWTAPNDESGVVAAWYKIGSAPSGRNDGTRSTDKPLTVTISNEGEQTLFVWLEDAAGNSNSDNRAQGVVRFDATAPNGVISINQGAATTLNSTVTLSLAARDNGGSGLTDMRFSNDGLTYSDWQPFADTHSWELAQTAGTRTVFTQFRDLAGNVSAAAQDNIQLIFAERIQSGAAVAASVAAQAASDQFMIDVPAGTAQLLVQARSADGGDIDLYVRAGEPVAFEDGGVQADFASITPLSSEALTLNQPQENTYFVAVVNRNTQTHQFDLVVTLTPEQTTTVQALALGAQVAGQAEATEGANRLSTAQFRVEVDDNTEALSVLLRSQGPGNLRLHIRRDSPVTWAGDQAVADWTSSSGGGAESIVLMGAALPAGIYYIAIENLEPYAQEYTLSIGGSQ